MVRDFEIERHEFTNGFTQFTSDLQLGEYELDCEDTFNDIAEGQTGDVNILTFGKLTSWYADVIGAFDLPARGRMCESAS